MSGLHGFSETGPYAGRPAYDDIIQGGSGLAALMAPLAGEPRFTPMVAADKTCGLMAVWAVAAALLHRERTGEGQFVEVPMFEAMAHFNTMEHLYGHVFDPPLAPMGYPRVLARWRKPYPTADGHLNVLAYNDGQWRRLVEAAGRPELADDPLYADLGARTENVESLYAVVGEILSTRTTEEWIELLERLEIPYMRVNALEDLPHDPHLKAVGFFRPYGASERRAHRPARLPGALREERPCLYPSRAAPRPAHRRTAGRGRLRGGRDRRAQDRRRSRVSCPACAASRSR